MQDTEHKIRERAYQLWLESGAQDGNADSHWLTAQREILDASMGELGSVAKNSSKPKKPKRAPTPRKKTKAA